MATNDDDFVLTRVFDAPRRLVWQAWTDPTQLAAWWGPHAFSTRCEMDLREGGKLRITMVGTDGAELPMTGVFREVRAPERLVIHADLAEHPPGWHGLPGNPSTKHTTSVLLEEVGQKTRVTLRMQFESPEMQAALRKMGAAEGWTQSFEKLDWQLAADRSILTSRIFAAPRALVWKMWTDPEHIVHWWGPNGFSLTIHKMEVRPGGVWEFVMHGPDGTDYQNQNIYREIVENERLVMSHVSGPIFEMTATFAEWAEKTRVSVRMLFESASDRERVAKERGAVEGLEQTLNRLGQRLG